VTPAQGGEEPNAGAAQEPNGGAPAAAGSGASGGRMAACDQPGGDAGPCDALVHAWFFDKMRGACMPYVYGGCQASDNHFESQVECEGACGGALYSTCPAAPNDGSCDGSVTTCRYPRVVPVCRRHPRRSIACLPIPNAAMRVSIRRAALALPDRGTARLAPCPERSSQRVRSSPGNVSSALVLR
jgi:hypothetical protein